MRLLEERSRGRLTVRVTDCGCVEGCDARAVFATTHPRLWVCTGASTEDEIETDMEFLLCDELVEEDRPSALVDHGLALFGLTWRQLMRDPDVVVAQLQALDGVPDWMLRVPLEQVWQARRCVFGRDLSRVPRALWALHAAYVPDAPAVAHYAR